MAFIAIAYVVMAYMWQDEKDVVASHGGGEGTGTHPSLDIHSQ